MSGTPLPPDPVAPSPEGGEQTAVPARQGSRAASGALLILVSRTLSKIAVLATLIMTQRALGREAYGDFSEIVVLGSIAGIVADLGFQVIFVRETSRRRDQLGHYLGVVLAAKIPLGLASGVVLVTITLLFAPKLLPLVPPSLLLLLTNGTANVLRACFFANRELRYEAVAVAIETITLFTLTLVLVVNHAGVAAFLWAYTAAYALPGLYALLVIRRRYTRVRLVWDRVTLRRVTRESIPFAVAFVLGTLYFRIDVVMLGSFRGPDQVGTYSAAVKFIDGITFIAQAVMTALFPTLSGLYQQGGEALRDAYIRAYRALALLSMPLAAAGFALAPEVVRYTGALPDSAAGVASSLRILSLSLFVMFEVNAFLYILGAMDRQRTFAWLTGLSVVFNVAVNVVVIPLYPRDRGYEATSWTTLATEVFLFGIGYVALSRALGRLSWLRPALPIAAAGVAMGGVMLWLERVPLLALPAGAAVYVAVLLVTRGLTRDDVQTARALVHRRG